MKIDKLDEKILSIITKELLSYSELARQLQVSESTIRNRVEKMKQNDFIKIKACVNINKIEDKQLILLGLKVPQDLHLLETAQKIKELSNVISVNVTTGRYDIFVEVLVGLKSGLIKFITQELTTIKGIENSESYITMLSYGKYV